jgi:hypothetical protein
VSRITATLFNFWRQVDKILLVPVFIGVGKNKIIWPHRFLDKVVGICEMGLNDIR